MFYRGFLPLFVLIAATVMACSDSSDRRSAVIPQVPQVPEAPQITSVRTIVETLAADEFEGRDNQSPGSALNALGKLLIGSSWEYASELSQKLQ